nr:hypothetical protein [Tanacetum cinerariifolium]
QDVARAYAAGSDNRQQYAGTRPLCPKSNVGPGGPCCPRCNKSGKIARVCRDPTNAKIANVARDQRGGQTGQKDECGAQGHFRRYSPKRKNNLKNNNNNRGN